MLRPWQTASHRSTRMESRWSSLVPGVYTVYTPRLEAEGPSMLDVDHQARSSVIGEGHDADACFRCEADDPGALRLEVSGLHQVDQGREAGRELGRADVAARAILHLLGPAPHRQLQEALAIDLDREAGPILAERRLGAVERSLGDPIGELEDDPVVIRMRADADIVNVGVAGRRVHVNRHVARDGLEILGRDRLDSGGRRLRRLARRI